MIELKKGKQSTAIDVTKLSKLCLELAGGGYTPQQTAKAMQYQQTLLAGLPVKANGFTVKLV